jgi:hypothetical protein
MGDGKMWVNCGKLPEYFLLPISLTLGSLGLVWSWKSIPGQNRQKILELIAAQLEKVPKKEMP